MSLNFGKFWIIPEIVAEMLRREKCRERQGYSAIVDWILFIEKRRKNVAPQLHNGAICAALADGWRESCRLSRAAMPVG
jgi:hypothetical protein